MPERGIGWFIPKRLEDYIACLSQSNKKSFTLPPLNSLNDLDTGLITLDGITLERAGNLLNSARKSHDKSTVGIPLPIAGGHKYTNHFVINNRRAIIGHKLTVSFSK
jgi:hypothetical protein